MKRMALALLCLILLAAWLVVAQDATLGLGVDDALLLAAANRAPLDSFAFDYEVQYEVNLDSFRAAAQVTGSGAVDRNAPALSASLAGALTLGTAQSIPLSSEARWVDGTLYLNSGEGWQALEDAPTAIADRVGEFTGLSVDTETLSGWNLMGVDGLDDFLTTITSADPSTFVTAERLDDEGQTAHFQIAADLHALFDSDAFVDAIIALGNAQGSDLIISSRDDVAEMLHTNNQAVDPAMLTIDEYVGLDDGLIHRIAVNLKMEIAPEKAGYVDAPFVANLSLDMTLRDHNQPQAIAAPDGATIVPELAMTAPAPEMPGDGVTQYTWVGAVDANTAYTQALDLQAGDVVTITARRLSLEFDTIVSLVSPGGDLLTENDDHETAAFFASAYDSQIFEFAVLESGTYTVELAELDGAAGSFVLTVSIERG